MSLYPTPLPADSGDDILPFTVDVPQAALDDLKARLANTRWPDAETVDDHRQGVPLETMRTLADYWREEYNWRDFEARLNALPHYRTRIDGLGIHFIHVRSPEPDALPVIMTHGWPGSIAEFMDVIGPLTDPVAHGGRAEDAFHLVVPSLPGYGFSDKPVQPGWDLARVGRAWSTLMLRLGYERFAAQGGDWGALLARKMAHDEVAGLAGIHVNLLLVPPPRGTDMTAPEAARWAKVANEYQTWGSGYSTQQSTRPQTLGYGLADSPVGQAAWIYEKFQTWTDRSQGETGGISRQALFDNISLYWLTDSAASAARLYWESFRTIDVKAPSALPVAASIFPGELSLPPKSWAERFFPDLIYWNEPAKGGHFAAMEQPEIFVREVRGGLRPLR